MQMKVKTLLGLAAVGFATQAAAAQITFYEHDGFRGRAFTTDKQVWNFEKLGFNDRASSAVVDNGRWEVCTDAKFEGRCVVLRPGSYDSLSGMGLNDRVSSVRPVSRNAQHANEAPAPLAAPTYEYRRASARVLSAGPSVRAVSAPQQRLLGERQQDRGGANVPGAIAGAVIGGILGHQVGGGRGQDIATAGGAVAGAAVGANVGRGGGEVYGRDVQRCENVSSGRPAYWDVTYSFRGVQHRVQMSAPPGRTVTVNGNGEPRGNSSRSWRGRRPSMAALLFGRNFTTKGMNPDNLESGNDHVISIFRTSASDAGQDCRRLQRCSMQLRQFFPNHRGLPPVFCARGLAA